MDEAMANNISVCFLICFQKGIKRIPVGLLNFWFTAYTHCPISSAVYRHFQFSPKFKLQTKEREKKFSLCSAFDLLFSCDLDGLLCLYSSELV